MRTLAWLLTLVVVGVSNAQTANPNPMPSPKDKFEWGQFRSIAVQNRGRMKPFDTYARETALYVTGKVNFQGFTPEELVFSWLTSFDKIWESTFFIRVDYGPLKKILEIDESRNYFSPIELRSSEGLRKMVQAAMKKQQDRERPSDLEKKGMQVQNQLGLVEAIVRGEDFTILPNPEGMEKPWFGLAGLIDPNGQLPYSPAQRQELSEKLRPLLQSYLAGDAATWNKSVGPFANYLKGDLAKGAYPTDAEMSREILYNDSRPFRWAWVFYSIAFIALLSYLVSQNHAARLISFGALACGYGMHLYGFGLRCWIAGRPPVTNMYESIIWVTFGCMTFAMIVWAVYKNAVIPTAASVFAIAGLVLADNLPSVLDPAINPLEPVLRSNYWLTIHVLTITLSYAAFALSLCLGNVVLGNYLFRPENSAKIQQLTLYMYRAVQIGVVLLAAGTILGGVWADYSWGRFWGWDPKEVWALIALLLYLAVLHGRFTGWLKGFGFATTTVFCFLGVLMAWYGVNFVLGVGLHSYGFGSGGLQYVAGYVFLQVAFIVAAYMKYQQAKKVHPIDTAIFPKGK